MFNARAVVCFGLGVAIFYQILVFCIVFPISQSLLCKVYIEVVNTNVIFPQRHRALLADLDGISSARGATSISSVLPRRLRCTLGITIMPSRC